MIKTFGLTHIALSVKDPIRSAEFYKEVFGARKMYAGDTFIQIQTPGSHDIIVLEKSGDDLPKTGGIRHFGFRLTHLTDIRHIIAEVENVGGTIKESGEFCPGEPYVFFYDPDGYEVEVWYEKPVAGFE
jgi:catechol 2,3-dioxygenase-like lactoylglutathione lyase family enzyme